MSESPHGDERTKWTGNEVRKHFPEYICPMYSGKHSPEEPPPESTLAGLFRYFRAARRARIDSRTTSAGRHATRTRTFQRLLGLMTYSFASTQGTARDGRLISVLRYNKQHRKKNGQRISPLPAWVVGVISSSPRRRRNHWPWMLHIHS